MRPKWEEPIHRAKELQPHRGNETTSQAFNRGNKTYDARLTEAISLWPWEMNHIKLCRTLNEPRSPNVLVVSFPHIHIFFHFASRLPVDRIIDI